MKAKNEVTVYIGDKAYLMSKKAAEVVINTGKTSVKNGVYAAKSKKTVILLNEPNITDERFKELCRTFNKKGFVVLHNRGMNNG